MKKLASFLVIFSLPILAAVVCKYHASKVQLVLSAADQQALRDAPNSDDSNQQGFGTVPDSLIDKLRATKLAAAKAAAATVPVVVRNSQNACQRPCSTTECFLAAMSECLCKKNNIECEGFDEVPRDSPMGISQWCALSNLEAKKVVDVMNKSGAPVKKISLTYSRVFEHKIEYTPKDQKLSIRVSVNWMPESSPFTFDHGPMVPGGYDAFCNSSANGEVPYLASDGRIDLSGLKTLYNWRDYTLNNEGKAFLNNLRHRDQ